MELAVPPSLTRFSWIYIAAAIATMALKGGAYLVTGSVGLLSDALESLVNLAAAMMALAMLTIAARPPDEDHTYGHGKAEYFASGFEGALILGAALIILYVSALRLLEPRAIAQPDIGLLIAGSAALLNVVVARLLAGAAVRYESITLESNARHLMTDVWTSVGVIGGVALAAATGWYILDPLLAIAVALHILRSGLSLLRRSALGLLDTALPADDLARIEAVLERYRSRGIEFHALRTRRAGARRFVSMHVLVPGDWSVQLGHEVLEQIEQEIRAGLRAATVFTHLEPIEDPVSWEDTRLERGPPRSP
jgi:cation diffusion facilitator family transporter